MLATTPLPAALLDLDRVDANRDVLLNARARKDVTLRVATKSIRHPTLLAHLLKHRDIVGLMTFSAHEAVALADAGFDDLLMGYPCPLYDDARALVRLHAAGTRVIAVVDNHVHVDMLAAAAQDIGVEDMPVCLDIDASWQPLGNTLHIGVRRSAVRTTTDALHVATHIAKTHRLQLTALLAYEAQVAGLPDTPPANPLVQPALALIKQRSVRLAASRRRRMLKALRRAGHPITLVNGGGTGSIASTSRDRSVTEVTVGSGFVCPHLFDHYRGLPLQAALFFALPVARCGDPGYVTCAGGGYIASGATNPDRSPQVHAPQGLTPLGSVDTGYKRGVLTKLAV